MSWSQVVIGGHVVPFTQVSPGGLVNFQLSSLHATHVSHPCPHWLLKSLPSQRVTTFLPLWTRPRIVEICLSLWQQLLETENVLCHLNWTPTQRELVCLQLKSQSIIILFPWTSKYHKEKSTLDAPLYTHYLLTFVRHEVDPGAHWLAGAFSRNCPSLILQWNLQWE